MKYFLLLLLLLLFFLLTACASPSVTSERIVPPRFRAASHFRTVALLPFHGDTGGNFSAEVEDNLKGVAIGQNPYFTMADKHKVAVTAMAYPESRLVDPDVDAVRAIGARLDVQAVITGKLVSTVNERTTREHRTICRKTAEDGGCTLWGETDISCIQREARVIFSPRMVAVATGKTVYSGELRGESGTLVCADNSTRHLDRETLIDRAEEQAIRTFRRDIAPYFVADELPVMDSSSGIPSGEGRDLFVQGVLLAEQGEGKRACQLWKKAEPFAPEAPGLVFNLGVCAESDGNLEQALSRYQKVAALREPPDGMVADAQKRIRNELDWRSRLAADSQK